MKEQKILLLYYFVSLCLLFITTSSLFIFNNFKIDSLVEIKLLSSHLIDSSQNLSENFFHILEIDTPHSFALSFTGLALFHILQLLHLKLKWEFILWFSMSLGFLTSPFLISLVSIKLFPIYIFFGSLFLLIFFSVLIRFILQAVTDKLFLSFFHNIKNYKLFS